MKTRRLWILLLWPALAWAQSPYYGTRIAAIQLSEAYDPTDIDVLTVKQGDIITAENLRASIEALYRTGHYRYVEVDASQTPEGTRLVFNVTPHYFFSTIRFSERGLSDRTIASTLRVPIGSKFSTAPITAILAGAKQLLEDAGHFNAEVTPEYVHDDETRLVAVNLHANVKAENRARVGRILFIGGQDTFPEAGRLQKILDVSPGDHFSAEALARGVSELLRSFSELGFLNTRVTAHRDYDAVRNLVNLTITIEPGQFVYVSASGYTIEAERLRELVPVFEEAAYDPDLLREGRARIEEFLQQEGYSEAVVADPEEIQAPLNNAVQVNFVIQPGDRHEVRAIRIQGNVFFSEQDLRARLKTREKGFMNRGVFSSALLKEDVASIEALYRRAGFEDVQVSGMPAGQPGARFNNTDRDPGGPALSDRAHRSDGRRKTLRGGIAAKPAGPRTGFLQSGSGWSCSERVDVHLLREGLSGRTGRSGGRYEPGNQSQDDHLSYY
jgi:outer membrane protein assembly factor BamA